MCKCVSSICSRKCRFKLFLCINFYFFFVQIIFAYFYFFSFYSLQLCRIIHTRCVYICIHSLCPLYIQIICTLFLICFFLFHAFFLFVIFFGESSLWLKCILSVLYNYLYVSPSLFAVVIFADAVVVAVLSLLPLVYIFIS